MSAVPTTITKEVRNADKITNDNQQHFDRMPLCRYRFAGQLNHLIHFPFEKYNLSLFGV